MGALGAHVFLNIWQFKEEYLIDMKCHMRDKIQAIHAIIWNAYK